VPADGAPGLSKETEQHAVPTVVAASAADSTALESHLAAFESHPSDQLAPESDWQIELEMAAVRQLVAFLDQHHAGEGASIVPSTTASGVAGNVRSGGATPGAPHRLSAQPETNCNSAATHWLAWTAIGPGAGLLACGSVLMIWSVLAHRDDLWSVGLPLAALGQGGLFLGLISQLAASSTAKMQLR
jgi:hypothetical protein